MADDNQLMAGNRSLLDQPDEIWPSSGITVPGFNPNGVLGGMADLHPPYNSLNMLMTPEEQADISSEDVASTASDVPTTVSDGAALVNPVRTTAFTQAGSDPLAGSVVCPSPSDMTLYRVGGNVGALGGKLSTYGAGFAAATAPALLIPGAQELGAAGAVVGGAGVAAGDTASAAGRGLQLAAGLHTGLQTGDWGLAAAAAAPAIADTLAPSHPLIGNSLDDQLQKVIESGNRILQSCRGLGE